MIQLRIELTPEARETLAAVRRIADKRRVLTRIAGVMADQDQLTVEHISNTKLHQPGPETLGVRSGRLWKSLRTRRPVVTGNAVISGFGSNVVYLRAHEFGFAGDVQVREHTRRFARLHDETFSHFGGMRPISLQDAETLQGRRKKIHPGLHRGQQTVKAHTRHMVIPARAPLYHGTAERMSAIGAAVSQTIVDEFMSNGGENG